MNPRLIAGFTWDDISTEKLEVHGLCPEDVEDLFDQDPLILRHPDHPNRWLALGLLSMPDDLFLLVSFELDDETGWVRVVTAFEPTSDKWWRLYAKSKGIKT